MTRAVCLPLLLAALLLAALLPACVPCDDREVPLAEACVPSTIDADTEIAIEVREACGLSCAETPACTATFEADTATIFVLTSQLVCPDCVDDGTCANRVVSCLLPAVPPGSYSVELPGLGARSVSVRSGAARACSL